MLIRNKWLRTVVVIMLFFSIATFLSNFKQLQNMNYFNFVYKYKETPFDYIIKTNVCRIPSFEIFDKDIIKYINDPEPLVCDALTPPLVNSSLHALYPDDFYNITCCYKEFKKNKDDRLILAKHCESLPSRVYINNTEYLTVVCKQNKEYMYVDFHSFVPIKRKTYLKNKLNVLIIGMDSVSNQNIRRQMPLTINYLMEELGAIEMLGFNKIGDASFPNLMAMLCNQTEEELTRSCLTSKSGDLDNCPFIWKNYQEAGYLTAFAEDTSLTGALNYRKHGFKKEPTDYYWHPFISFAESIIGHKKLRSTNLCFGPRAFYQVLLDYITKFTLSLKNEPYFGFFWESSLTRDYLNFPSLADNDYKLFFQNLNNSNVLNNTIVIFLSDHGIRWNDILDTYQGLLETRLPFCFFLIPKWFSKKYPLAIETLKLNSEQLITPFDLYETLIDLINIDNLSNEKLQLRISEDLMETSRSMSLFLPIPATRTCDDAGISSYWCSCLSDHHIDVFSNQIETYANYVMNFINNVLLEHHGFCAHLYLKSILRARKLVPTIKLHNKLLFTDYLITLKTTPGDGIFQTTVRCYDKNIMIAGSVFRFDDPGNQTDCIEDDSRLRVYCYCIVE